MTSTKGYQKYQFKGMVIDGFSRVICAVWQGTTYATSAARAMSNLAYQFKKHAGLTPAARVRLCGNVNIA